MQGKWLADIQYLLASEDASLLNVVNDSVLAQLLSIGSSAGSFDDATDSLEAISNAIAGISTSGTANAFLAAVGGALDDAIATGAVSDAKTAISYIKQIVTAVIAVQADLDNATDGLGAIKALIDAIPTVMVGTNDAALASVLGALNNAAATGAVSDGKTQMAYLKQAITRLEEIVIDVTGINGSSIPAMVGTDGAFLATVGGALNAAASTGAVGTATTLMGYIKQAITRLEEIVIDVTGINGSSIPAMVGTNSAALASVAGALDTAEATGVVGTGTTLMGYTKQLVTDTETLSIHTKLFTGDVFYADAAMANDDADGSTPAKAKKTINAAIGVAATGDAIIVKAGTYAENVVMSKASMELWCEIGTIIDGDGTCLTVSGGSCRVVGPVKITPASNQVGVHVLTNEGNRFDNVRVKGTTALAGWDFDIGGSILHECSGAGIAADGKCFDIGGNGTKLYSCYAAGTTTSYGFFADGTITQGYLSDCISVGNQKSGYYLDGVAAMTVVDCTSGSGDGAAVDVDNANVWCNFCFDDCVIKSNVLSVAGGGGTSTYNLYQLTGAVKVIGIFADVETALTGTNTDCFLQLSSTNGDVEISKDDAGVTLGALGVGSVIMRLDKEDKVLVVGDVTLGPALIDQTDVKEEGFRIIQDRKAGVDVDTYIQFVHTCADTGTGTLHWHCKWEPVGEGFLKAA